MSIRIGRPGPGARGARIRAVALAAALVALLAGCSGVGGGRSLLIYNGQHPQLTRALTAAFTKQTGISVRVRTNDGIVLADQLLQEGADSRADVYLAENSPELVTLDEHRLLARLDRSLLEQIPGRYDAPTGDWAGIALRVGGLAYDPALAPAAALPASVLDLARPAWKGRVGLAPTDSDFPPLVGAVSAVYGVAATRGWLAGLRRNAQIYQSDESVVAAVERGDVATGLVNAYYWYRLALERGSRAMRSAIHYFPNHDVGSVVNIAGAALLAASRHRRDAERFLAFLVSPAAQQIISRGEDFEYPARPGVRPNGALPPLAAIAPRTLGVAALGDDQAAARLIKEAQLA